MNYDLLALFLFTISASTIPSAPAAAAESKAIEVQVDWNKTIITSKTVATMMHMVHPVSRKGTPIHDRAIEAIKVLDAKYVRYMNWNPYPRLSIAALEPPTKETTSWDFSLIDAELIPYLEATRGREPVVSFAAIPPWMLISDKKSVYPDDPNESVLSNWIYGKELIDPSGEQVAQYFARIASWYTQGGFTDENGKYHHSGYRYELPWWEVLNEADYFTPEQYTRLSDAIIAAVRKVTPKTRFIGLSIYGTSPEFFEYWLNPKNHRPNIPLDMIAYHFYAFPNADLSKYDATSRSGIEAWQYSFFDQAAGFVERVKYIESIRRRLSPTTQVNLNELGTYIPGEFDASAKDPVIPDAYWNLSAGVFAFLYMELSKQGIDILAQSLLAAGPQLAPSNTMLNWNTGKPNARYHVLKLLNDSFALGDRLVETKVSGGGPHSDLAAQAFITPNSRKLLLINKRGYPVTVSTKSAGAGAAVQARIVDERSGEDLPRKEAFKEDFISLAPFAVAVITASPWQQPSIPVQHE